MLARRLKQPIWACFLIVCSSCIYPVREQTDLLVCDLAERPLDVEPAMTSQPSLKSDKPTVAPDTSFSQTPKRGLVDPEVHQTQAKDSFPPTRELQRKNEPFVERFLQTVPPELRPRLTVKPPLPPVNPTPEEKAAYQKQVRELIKREFPSVPKLGHDPVTMPGPEGRPLTLADLQRLGMSNSPLLRQAASDVEAARGAVIQAGAYPNPNAGYQSDTAGTGATAGFQGVFIEQTIKTGGKLKLAQAMAQMDLQNAQLALRRSQTDLAASVRGGYFAVVVARENLRISRFLVDITDTLYKVNLDLFEQGIATYYDAQQMRVLLLQAHGIWIQARNRYTSAWAQLAAALGLPGMPPTDVEGRATIPVMKFNYDDVRTRVLGRHTDVRTAENTVQKARYNLRLAQVTPIPDLALHLAVEKDYSVPPFAVTHSVQLGGPLPIWDHNKGNIIQAQGALLRAAEEAHRVRDDLTTRLADAFERYENNRTLLFYYLHFMLSDEVSAFIRSLASQGIDSPLDIRSGVSNIVANDQLLVSVFTGYTAALAAQWTAVVDIASLLQADDLFDVMEEQSGLPGGRQMAALPCCHPCSPVRDEALRSGSSKWPSAVPALSIGPMPTLEQPHQSR
jgi:cobalt-zinc-cadmium efflux system outer membrane protein